MALSLLFWLPLVSPVDTPLLDAAMTNNASGGGMPAHSGWRQTWHSCVMLLALAGTVVNGLQRISVNSDNAAVPGQADSQSPTTIAETDEPVTAELKLTGTVTAHEATTIYAESGGRITEILVSAGDVVAPGSPLVRLSNPKLRHQLSAANRDVAAANRELERLDLRINQERAESQVTLLQSRNTLDESVRTYESDTELFKLGFISRQKLRSSRERLERLRMSF